MAPQPTGGRYPTVLILSTIYDCIDIFLKMAGVLKIYSNYVQNFDSALRMLDEVKKKEKISHFLSVCNLYDKHQIVNVRKIGN